MEDMEITDRQKEILNSIVAEYIQSAQPVSSKLLEKKHKKFQVCPATIRNEMQKLTEAGFIFQPHTSAGRVPTDKGYRFFVDDLLEEETLDDRFDSKTEEWMDDDFKDALKLIQSLTRNLALSSSSLALGYLADEKILWKEGWDRVLREPEFQEKKTITDFFGLLSNFEKEMDSLEMKSGLRIFIGKENPFPKAREFSTIIARCRFPEKEQGFLAIMGPKRMAYDRNINSLNHLIKILEEL